MFDERFSFAKGVIFEAYVVEDESVESVAGGGRYDKLMSLFESHNRSVSGVGVSFGIERLLAIQKQDAYENVSLQHLRWGI